MNNPFEDMTDKEIADYVRGVNEEFSFTNPEFASCQDEISHLVLEAKKRGPLDLRITIDKDGEIEIWRVRVEKETEGEIVE